MNWNNLHEATSSNEKPTPGWLFRDICADAKQNPQDIPDTAEYLMRCAASENQTSSMKACLALRHLADEVPGFRRFMQQCPNALDILNGLAQPPTIPQAVALERPEAKIARQAASRALSSCLAPITAEHEHASALKQRIQGFGNYAPPPDPDQQPKGLVDQVAGFVGDAIGDTVDDFREKGAVGAVRDGLADAADLIVDGVGAFWDLLGGRRGRGQQQEEERICQPMSQPPSLAPVGAPAFVPYNNPQQQTYRGAFGQGAVGAGYSFPAAAMQQASVPVPAPVTVPAPETRAPVAAPAPAAPAPAPPHREPEDLLSFDDAPSPRAAAPQENLLSFDDDAPASGSGKSSTAGSQAATRAPPSALELKNRGNDLVREKRYQEAVREYEAALALLSTESVAGGQEPAAAALCATLHANVALCWLQQQLYRRAVEAATRSIEHDATHAKAYYRRCLAYRALKMYSEAMKDLEALHFCKHQMTPAEMQKLQQSLAAGAAAAADGGGTAPQVAA